MERAPLRPVPSRPPSAVDPAEAIRHVTGELSALDAPAAEALALIVLAGRSRVEVAGEARISSEQLAEALARARKALRRRLHPLPGSGWCERAERLISDRIDDALEDPGPARLRVHLANCSRCVEHERRLGQAQDALVAGFAESTAPVPEAEAEAETDAEPEARDEPAPAPPAALRIVDPATRATSPPSAAEPAPDEAAARLETLEPLTPEADAPIRLPPAGESPALPEPEDPPALPDPEGTPALPDAGEPAAIAEAEESPALAEAEESPALAEAEQSSALAGAEEPPAVAEAEQSPASAEEPPANAEAEESPGIAEAPGAPALADGAESHVVPEADAAAVPAEGPEPAEADEQPTEAAGESGSLAEVVPIPTPPRVPRPAPSPPSPSPLHRGPPQSAPSVVTPLRARRSSPPNPGWARVAATYAPLAPPDGSRAAANDDTLTAVGPLLAIATLALLLLAFVVLALSV